MTEEQLYKRYNEIRSENVAVRFVDGDIITGKLDSFTSGVNNEPDEASNILLANMNCMPVNRRNTRNLKLNQSSTCLCRVLFLFAFFSIAGVKRTRPRS